MVLKGKKVLVTGAGGFIGSHLVEALIKEDCCVRAFVHYNSLNSFGWIDSFPKKIKNVIDVFCGDIIDPHGVKSAMKDCEIVFHLAALIGIPYSYHSPDTYVETNVKGTLNVLQAAKELKVKKILHTSTSEVYGTAQFIPITEDHPVNPQSPYSATKAGADFLALSFYRSFDLPVVIVRPFNVYGPRQSARAIIPTIISQIASGKKIVKVGSLVPTRDFTYVKDTAQGFIAAAKSDQALGEIINIGSNFEISVGDLIAIIVKLMGAKIKIKTEKERQRPKKSEVERLYASNQKARKLIGWQPQYSFKNGLKETINWFTNPENLKLYKPKMYNI